MHASNTAARAGTAGQIMAGVSAGCFLFLGCAAPPRYPSPDEYVFFSHYPELRRLEAPPGVFLYANPRQPIHEREQFIVNPAQVGFQPQAGHWLSSAESQKWADVLRDEVIASLSERFQVVETPAADVLRVSLAVADIHVREPAHPPDVQPAPEFQPFLIMLISDSRTGEAVVLLRDLNRGAEFAAAAQSDESAAREVLGEWARNLRVRLEEAGGAAAEPPTSETVLPDRELPPAPHRGQ